MKALQAESTKILDEGSSVLGLRNISKSNDFKIGRQPVRLYWSDNDICGSWFQVDVYGN